MSVINHATRLIVQVVALFLVCSAFTETVQAKHRILLLPTDFDVLEWSASGIMETVPDWTEAAESRLTEAASAVLGRHAQFEVVPLPDLTAEERAQLTEHVALYKLTAHTASQMLMQGGPWRDLRKNFDYTLGDGLKFLVERSGADFAACVAGAQVKSSGGRVAMFILLAAAGVAIPMGGAQLSAGVIDLNTGNVTWFDQSMALKGDVREARGADATLSALFGQYPKSRLLGRK